VVQGRGERLTPLKLTGERWVVLVHPGFPIETRWAYERLAGSRSAVAPLSGALLTLSSAASVSWDEVVPLMENDFEAALFPSYPALGEIKSLLLRQGAEAALLSGSGATVFGVFKDRDAAVRAEAVVERAEGWRAYAVRAGDSPTPGGLDAQPLR
jgi:4-diphosphocytidyl-2-C-methyl-D-erythritol kinase